MAIYIDISIRTNAQTTVFPGDPAPRVFWPGWTHEKGDPANVGFFEGGLHHGTHVDAPWHFIAGGKKLHEMPLDHWLGDCFVVDMTAQQKCVDGAALDAAEIPKGTRRLLLKTRNSLTRYWERPWDPNFIYIHHTAARWCVQHELLLIGLDYLTIDPPHEPTFPSHLELLGNEVLILENIDLRPVEPGSYELLAAPINLTGTDGGWCRALLRKET